MENRKDIGKAIKDKLADLDKSPSDALWTSLEKDLDKNMKKKAFFWLPPAMLILGLTTIILMNTENIELTDKVDNNSNIKKLNSNSLVISTDVKTEEKSLNDTDYIKIEETNNDLNFKPTNNAIDQTTIKVSTNSSEKELQTVQEPTTKTVKQQKVKKSLNPNQGKIKKTETTKLVSETKKTIVYNNDFEEYEVVKKYKIIVKKTTTTSSNVPQKKKPKATDKKTIATKTLLKKTIATSKKTASTKKQITKSTPPKTLITKPESFKTLDTISKKQSEISNQEILKKQNQNNEIKTTIQINSFDDKKGAVLIPEKKLKPKKEYKADTTKIVPENDFDYLATVFYGPSHFGSLSKKATINEQLDNVKKIHPISDHYGFYIKTKYKKFSFSVGVSKINLLMKYNLDSNNVISNFSNIDLDYGYTQTSINNMFQANSDIKLTQKLTLYEMPFELYYTLNNPEDVFTIDVFSGISILYVDKNILSLSSNETDKINFGSTKNILKLQLSYDLGLSLNYKLNNHYSITFNPILKQYLSKFNDDVSGIKPYSISIQSGLTYMF